MLLNACMDGSLRLECLDNLGRTSIALIAAKYLKYARLFLPINRLVRDCSLAACCIDLTQSQNLVFALFFWNPFILATKPAHYGILRSTSGHSYDSKISHAVNNNCNVLPSQRRRLWAALNSDRATKNPLVGSSRRS